MAINALLSPAASAKTVEGEPGKTPKEAGDAFAGVFAEVVGKVPEAPAVALPTPSPILVVGEPTRSAGFSPHSEPGLQPGEASGAKAVTSAPPVQEASVFSNKSPLPVTQPARADAPKPPRADVTPEAVATPVAKTPIPSREGAVNGTPHLEATEEDPASQVASPVAEAEPAPPPKVGTSKAKAPKDATVRKGGTPTRKVEAPPDPPPAKAAPEEGATKEAPNAPVERPDPTSETTSPVDENVFVPLPLPLPLPTATVVPAAPIIAPSQAPISNSVQAAPSPANAVKENATPAAPVGVPRKAQVATLPPAASVVVTTPPAVVPKQTALATEAEPKGTEDASPIAFEPQIVPAVIPSPTQEPDTPEISINVVSPTVASDANTAPSVAPPVVLPQALDLGVATAVVQAAVPAQAVVAAPVPNARVAKVATDLAAPKTVAATKPVETTLKAAPATDAVAIPPVAADTGGDPSGEDAPKHDAPPETPLPAPASTAKTVATERPEAGTDRPEVDRHLVVRQVADRIETLVASRPKNGLTVHLEPRDLGTVTLVVKGLQSALDVQVSASDERVRQSLDSSRPELAQALAPRGIELRELRVATASTTTSMNSNAGSGGSGANSEGRPRPQTPTQAFAKPSRAEARAPRARSNGRGVDLLV